MNPTRKQKAAIRAHWHYLILKFGSDGTVYARNGPGRAWGVLYAPHDTAAHVATRGYINKEVTP